MVGLGNQHLSDDLSGSTIWPSVRLVRYQSNSKAVQSVSLIRISKRWVEQCKVMHDAETEEERDWESTRGRGMCCLPLFKTTNKSWKWSNLVFVLSIQEVDGWMGLTMMWPATFEVWPKRWDGGTMANWKTHGENPHHKTLPQEAHLEMHEKKANPSKLLYCWNLWHPKPQSLSNMLLHIQNEGKN